ncbi:hypothetical protein M970_051460 [Encephalitozoon cuniculi EcunIII-L]|nr:hypothetical protein M970_051460 [Encephalitozoon cuniculi EcunIII-L]
MTDATLLERGGYKVLGVLCISRSLLSQKSGGKDANGMHKALIQNASGHKVVYFVDPIDFGAGSRIFLKENASSPLLRSTSYTITCKKGYRTNTLLVEKLLLRNAENMHGVKP